MTALPHLPFPSIASQCVMLLEIIKNGIESRKGKLIGDSTELRYRIEAAEEVDEGAVGRWRGWWLRWRRMGEGISGRCRTRWTRSHSATPAGRSSGWRRGSTASPSTYPRPRTSSHLLASARRSPSLPGTTQPLRLNTIR